MTLTRATVVLALMSAAHATIANARQPDSEPTDHSPTPETTAVINEGAAWLKQNALRVSTVLAGQGLEDLAKLDGIVGDARVVALGEPTHGTREAFQMKHRLLEYLVEKKGFSIFAIEGNMPEAYALNQYIIDGKGDPKALIAGMYFWTWQTQEVLAMVEWMRAWNSNNPPSTGKPRLQFTGFDMQVPDVAWKNVGTFVAAHAPDLTARNDAVLAELKTLSAQSSAGEGEGEMSATAKFPIEAARGKTVRLSAWIKTDNVAGRAGAWWQCERATGAGVYKGMESQPIKGTTDWTKYELTVDVPSNAVETSFGFTVVGEGAAWFDDIEIEIDGKKYEDPAKFSFDFENDAVRYISGGAPDYAMKRVDTVAHSGKKSLEIRSRTPGKDPVVNAAQVQQHAESLVAELSTRRDALAKTTSPRDVDWAIQNARIVAQAAAMTAAGPEDTNVRDASMAANVKWIAEQNPGKKLVLWAHNGHVARDVYMTMKPMGIHLAKTFGREMVVFGLATGTGTYTAMKQGTYAIKHDNVLAEPWADSVEQVFTTAGMPLAIVDLRGSREGKVGTTWAATPRPMRSIGSIVTDEQFYSCVPVLSYDVLVWLDKTTASRPLE
jgi:erythromycin esterase-like protein